MPTELSAGVAVPSAAILSAWLRRETMSAARSSSAALGLQNVQLAWAACSQYDGGAGGVELLSTHRPDGTWTMRELAAEKASCWFGSDAEQFAVVTSDPVR